MAECEKAKEALQDAKEKLQADKNKLSMDMEEEMGLICCQICHKRRAIKIKDVTRMELRGFVCERVRGTSCASPEMFNERPRPLKKGRTRREIQDVILLTEGEELTLKEEIKRMIVDDEEMQEHNLANELEKE